MATKLDDISVAIGRLQAQFEQSETARIERNDSVDRKFKGLSDKIEAVDTKVDNVDTKVDGVASSLDSKIEKAASKYIGGAVGGALIVAGQYLVASLGLKFPHLG